MRFIVTFSLLMVATITLLAAKPAPTQEGLEIQRDVRLELVFHLRDPDRERWVEPIRAVLPAYEWRTADGQWHFEVLEGTGSAVGLSEAGEAVQVPLGVRLEVFTGVGLVEETADRRVWSLRGDVYLRSPSWELVELDYGFSVAVPTADATFDYPAVALPVADAEDLNAQLGALIDRLTVEQRGGGALTEVPAPLWGRPQRVRPFSGLVAVPRVTASPSKTQATDRDADRLLGRLLYVKGDYELAVGEDGAVLDAAELEEQTALLKEARILGSLLPLRPATHQGIAAVADAVLGQVAPSAFGSQIAQVIDDVRADLWLQLEAPVGDDLTEGPALFATHCASCHGPLGAGPPAGMEALVPAPPAFAEAVPGLTPRRAYNAVTFGIPGTAMVGFDEAMSAGQRWALAFYVQSLGIVPQDAKGEPKTLEQLAAASDEDLDAPGWQRHNGVLAAAQSPWLTMRRGIRRAARGEPLPSDVVATYRTARARLRRLDGPLARQIARLLFDVRRDEKCSEELALELARLLSRAEITVRGAE